MMFSRKSISLAELILISSSILIIGCSQSSQPLITTTLMETNYPSVETSVGTIRAPETMIAETPIPRLTSTKAGAVSISPKPIPTLNPQAAHEKVVQLMQSNNNCPDVCFWGISLEHTSFDEAIRLLKTIKSEGIKETNDTYINGYQIKNSNITISLTISASENVINNLTATVVGLDHPDVTGQDWFAFRPDNFLRENGEPQQINIIMSEGPEGQISYDMTWFYNQMYIQYIGNQVIIKPEHVMHVCPIEDHNIQRFNLWLGTYDQSLLKGGKELVELTSQTPNDLLEVLTGDREKACFDLDYSKIYP